MAKATFKRSDQNETRTLALQPGIVGSCGFSEDRRYRYWLLRSWSTEGGLYGKGMVVFVMLNPSKANHTVDDPTIRRCTDFARAWGYQALCILNIYAYVETVSGDLLKTEDPIGEKNDQTIRGLLYNRCRTVVVAWGALKGSQERAGEVLEELRTHGPVYCLGTNKDGSPKHPLYLKGDTELRVYRERATIQS